MTASDVVVVEGLRTGPVRIGMRQLLVAGTTLDYELRRSARRTLAITVTAAGAVVVTAPTQASEAQVERAVHRRRDWIRRRQRDAARLPAPPAPRAWVSGETHRYLGRQYRLRVTAGAPASVRLAGAYLEVTAPGAAPARVRRLMDAWYLRRAHDVFARRLATLVAASPPLGLDGPPPLLVRRLRTRWGSCSAGGRVLMNVEAIKLPAGCVDYVLLHELCHLREPHHGAAFWRLLAACMPDWERWRARLVEAEL